MQKFQKNLFFVGTYPSGCTLLCQVLPKGVPEVCWPRRGIGLRALARK